MQFRRTNLPFSVFLRNNIKEEGFLNLWRGNGTNLIRIFPFSGCSFVTYDFCKDTFLKDRTATNSERLVFGGVSAIVATSFTHPIDVIKHRLMCYKNINTFKEAMIWIYIKKMVEKCRNYFKRLWFNYLQLNTFYSFKFCYI